MEIGQNLERIEDYPLPMSQAHLHEFVDSIEWLDKDYKELHFEEFNEMHKHIITKYQEYEVFRTEVGLANYVYMWNKDSGQGWKIDGSEGFWHHLVNVFAEIVEQEGDCRNAKINS